MRFPIGSATNVDQIEVVFDSGGNISYLELVPYTRTNSQFGQQLEYLPTTEHISINGIDTEVSQTMNQGK